MTDNDEASVSEDDRPELESGALRRRLWAPEAARLLGDPIDFPPNEEFDFDPIRVRLERAVEIVERTSRELVDESIRRSNAARIGGLMAAVIGILALITALGMPQYAIAAWAVAAVEIVMIVRFSRRSRLFAVDSSELMRLSERYRPELERCETAADLRAFAERMKCELSAMWIEPEHGGERGS